MIRTPLGADELAFGVVTDAASVSTLVSYDTGGRVSEVELPQASAGGNRVTETFDYATANATNVHLSGNSEPKGFTRRVTFDAQGRLLTDTNAEGQQTINTWNGGKDELSAVTQHATDGSELKSTSIYDVFDRLTDSYGPAPSSWFG